MIREVKADDLNGMLNLYLHLHEVNVPEVTKRVEETWDKILNNPDYHLIVAEEDGKLVASCTCLIVPNLTREVTPYAVIENVVTHSDYRGRGLASKCLEYASEIAKKEGCYKMMLITGSSKQSTHEFYKKNGYHSDGKTAYYKTLKEVHWS